MESASPGQLILTGVPGTELDPGTAALFRRVQPGGFIIFGRNIESAGQLRKLIDDLRDLSAIEPIITIDQEGGRVSRLRLIGSEPPNAQQLREKGDIEFTPAALGVDYYPARAPFGLARWLGIAGSIFVICAVLKIAFVLVASVIAIKLMFGRESWRLGDEMPGRIGMTAWGFVVGLASSLMGTSGGSVSNMILTLYGKSIHRAVATSAGLGVPITIAGTIGYVLAGLPAQAHMPPFSVGFVSLIGFALMAPVSSFTAPYGARLAHALPKRRLEIGFGCFLLVVCARFVVSLVG
jgi:uncharacterized membrane protein YfcA